MRKYSSLFWYVALFLLVFITDRATKFFVLSQNFSSYEVASFLKFDLLFNRGISWGMFGSQNGLVFFLISFFIFLVTIAMIIYAYRRFLLGGRIIGETLIIASSMSNILDRILYGGVIDFIAINFGSWSWPVFNLADFFIVVGVFVITFDFLSN